MNKGEKSKPPADGIYFLIGANDLSETSSINWRKGLEFFGDTQLKITPPITAKKIILRNIIIDWIMATPMREII